MKYNAKQLEFNNLKIQMQKTSIVEIPDVIQKDGFWYVESKMNYLTCLQKFKKDKTLKQKI